MSRIRRFARFAQSENEIIIKKEQELIYSSPTQLLIGIPNVFHNNNNIKICISRLRQSFSHYRCLGHLEGCRKPVFGVRV